MWTIQLLLLLVISTFYAADAENVFVAFPKVLKFDTANRLYIQRENDAAGGAVSGDVSLVYLPKNGEAVETVRVDNFEMKERRLVTIVIPENLGNRTTPYCRLIVKLNTTEPFEEATIVPLQKPKSIDFVQTDKPVYKPGDKIRIRLLSVRLDTLAPALTDKAAFTSVVIQKPGKTKALLAKWGASSWKTAFKGFETKLPKDTRVVQLGTYTIFAVKADGTRISAKFEVKKYVLPTFLVELEVPEMVLVNDKEIATRICAKYTFGKPVLGRARVTACLKSYRKEICRKISGNLKPDGCGDFVFKNLEGVANVTAAFPLREWFWNVRFKSTVFEDGTGKSVDSKDKQSDLSSQPFKLKFTSENLYRPGLPYLGRIQARFFNGSVVPKPKVEVEISEPWQYFGRTFGYKEVLTGDINGVVKFSVPNLPTKSSITFRAKSVGYAEKSDDNYSTQEMKDAYTTLTLYKRSSIHGSVMTVEMGEVTTAAGCPTKVQLQLTSNVPLNDKKVHVQVVSRGELQHWEVMSPQHTVARCVSRDDKYGHFTCISADRIRCLPGWTGANCLTPVCADGCGTGVCMRPNTCTCPPNRSGPGCADCTKRKGCVHGRCIGNRLCVCYFGYSGYHCGSTYRPYRSINSETFTRDWIPEEMAPTAAPKPKKIINKMDLHQEHSPQKLTINIRNISLPIDRTFSKGAKIMVFFVHKEEVIAELVDLHVQTCLPNNLVSVNFPQKKALPGRKIKVELTSEGQKPHCALSISDAGLQAFKSGNDYDPTRDRLLSEIAELEKQLNREYVLYYGDKNYCYEQSLNNNSTDSSSTRYKVDFLDSSYAPKNAGLFLLTNKDLRTATCTAESRTYSPYYTSHKASRGGGKMMAKQAMDGAGSATEAEAIGATAADEEVKKKLDIRVRKLFPESWFWDVIDLKDGVKNVKELLVPDSITTWDANLMCISNAGLGIAAPTSVTVFKPFFVSLALPYSAIRGEHIRLPVSVHSYTSSCYEVEVTLKMNKQSVKDITPLDGTARKLCMCGKTKMTTIFELQFNSLGKVPIQIQGVAQKPSASCGTADKEAKSFFGIGDAVERKLLVEPEGIPELSSQGSLMCLNDTTDHHQFKLRAPKRMVPGSLNFYLSLTADIIGPSVNNLDALVHLPYGCGEQNLATMVPSVLVLKYLKASKDSAPELEQKAKSYIINGYNRQLLYRHPDGSFSAFGVRDRRGSTWLTAFTVRSFSEARTFYSGVDATILKEAVKFLLRNQRKDGCFDETGRVLSTYLQGGLGQNAELAMTSYVITALSAHASLVETSTASRKVTLEAINRGAKCLVDKKVWKESNYVVAMTAYAFAEMLSSPLSKESLKFTKENLETGQRIINRRLKVDGSSMYLPEKMLDDQPLDSEQRMWWRPRFSSADVETTAYAALALMDEESVRAGNVMQLVKWLSSQRNSLGGWRSTQDTVVSLRALADFGADLRLASTGKTHLKFEIVETPKNKKSENVERLLVSKAEIKEEDRLVENVRGVDLSMRSVSVQVSGTGCAMVLMNSVFNIPKPRHVKSDFKLHIFVHKGDKCGERMVNVGVQYRGAAKESGMALVTVLAPTGWDFAPKEDEKLLEEYANTGLKRADIDGRTLDLYLDSIQRRNPPSFKISMKQKFVVKNLKPSFVAVTDYYRPDKSLEAILDLNIPECA